MDKLLGLLSSLEAAIRYLLTGIVAAAVFFAALANPVPPVKWVVEHNVPAFATILAAGFLLFILYRLVFWVVGDYLAWWFGVSAPALSKHLHKDYPRALAHFLKWRYSDKIKESLGGYLTYRWAICHFCVVSAFSLAGGIVFRECGSLLDRHCIAFVLLMATDLIFGIFQCRFLFIVEREIYRPHA